MTSQLPTSGQIIAFRNDRLGGRLLMIVNAIRLSRLTGAPFWIHWHQGGDVSTIINDPEQFFDREFVARHFIDRERFLELRDGAVRPPERPNIDLPTIQALLAQGTNILIDDGIGVRAYPGEDADQIAKIGASIWREVPLAPAVAKVLADIRATIGPQTTAYHVRRGDILTLPRVMNRPWPNKYVYDEVYEIHIEQTLARGERPIVFSDDAATVNRLKGRYPEVIPAATLFDRESVTAGQADFLELLALSSCTRIVGPPQSAFSLGAASLGEVPIVDVELALDPEQRVEAGNRLLARLRAPELPKSMTAGDIGQSLVHLDKFLTAQGRIDDLPPILERHLYAGLDISFLYPRLIELHLLADDPDAAISAAKLMEARQVYHRPDYAKGQILQALAQLALDRPVECARNANNALWHDMSGNLVSEWVAVLYASGHLNDRNALPFSPAARALLRRTVSGLSDCRATMLATANAPRDALGRVAVHSIDPITWDWAPLMRSFARGALARHRLRAVYERNLERLSATIPGPDLASLTAVYDMHVGENDTWLDRLIVLADEFPENAMVQHRLSLAALQKRHFKLAAEAAESAAELAPDVPAHALWRSIMRQRQKRFRLAMTDIRVGLDAGLEFPGMYLRLASAAAQAGHPNVEKAAINAGISVAPRDIPLRLYRARCSHADGNVAEALADLNLIMNNDIVPESVTALRHQCLDQLAARTSSEVATESLGKP